MRELIVFNLRKKPLFLYSSLLALTFIYSYLLAIYFLEWTDLQQDIFTTLLFIGLIFIVVFIVDFVRMKALLRLEREQEKLDLYKQQITTEFNLDRESNIFDKINYIQNFMQNNFAQKGLLSVKILTLVNNTLHLYVENLEIKQQHEVTLKVIDESPEKVQNIQEEIDKNIKQNRTILEYLDMYIRELTSKTSNDHKIDSMQTELEHSMQMLKFIKPRE